MRALGQVETFPLSGSLAFSSDRRISFPFLPFLNKHTQQAVGDPHGQGGKPPCKQAKRVRPEGGCGVIPMEIFLIFHYFFPKKMTRFDHHFEAKD